MRCLLSAALFKFALEYVLSKINKALGSEADKIV